MKINTVPETGALHLEGELEIVNAEPLRQALLAALENESSELRLDLGAVRSCDATGAQLLWSTVLSARKRAKQLAVQNAPQTVAACLSALGFPEGVLNSSSVERPDASGVGQE